ncbi:MAG: GNAT family N-acetyltransferase [Gammaproteobacteria bacterium]|nr:GNAT family N-acetyltransferase [Gammaproteobacteria bacterium]
MIRIEIDPQGFEDWSGLLKLLRDAFAYMEARIDPPSSLNRMDLPETERKARAETLVLAFDDARLVWCAFTHRADDALYIGKVAVHGDYRGRGIARRMFEAADTLARAQSLRYVELQTRIELVENHATFSAMGFVQTAQSAHPGYDRPTSITMRKQLIEPTEPSTAD